MAGFEPAPGQPSYSMRMLFPDANASFALRQRSAGSPIRATLGDTRATRLRNAARGEEGIRTLNRWFAGPVLYQIELQPLGVPATAQSGDTAPPLNDASGWGELNTLPPAPKAGRLPMTYTPGCTLTEF